jgi:hypothetical protein
MEGYDCVDTSACIYVGHIGVEEPRLNRNLKVYPNPTSGMLNIDMNPNFGKLRIQLYTVQGLNVGSWVTSGNHIRLDVKSLSRGMYLVVVTDEDGNSFTEKVLLQ